MSHRWGWRRMQMQFNLFYKNNLANRSHIMRRGWSQNQAEWQVVSKQHNEGNIQTQNSTEQYYKPETQ